MFQTILPAMDNPYSQRLREIVDSFRAQRSRYMKVEVYSRHLSVLWNCGAPAIFLLSSSSSRSSSFLPAVDGGEAGRPKRADLQTLPGGGQERQRGSVVRGLLVPHAQGDPPASQLGLHMSHLPLYDLLLLLPGLLHLVKQSALSFFFFK